MFYGGEPNCAKLFSRIKELGKEYADNIENICAKDLLSDTLGLTVIFPDKSFIEEFNSLVNVKSPDIDSLSKARRMLQNTIVKRDLKKAEDFKQFTHSLPLRSGLTLNATDTQGDDIVILDGGIKLKKDSNFTTPGIFNYSLWIVESGKYPTTIHFRPKKGKPRSTGGNQAVFIDENPNLMMDQNDYVGQQDYDISMTNPTALNFQGGGKDEYIMQVGRLLKNSPDTLRVSIAASILTEYKIELMRDRCATRNPLLVKAASLYNWLSMYYQNILNIILPITDIHPGVNLLLLILDPLSPITIEMLLGTGNSSDAIHISDGWRGSELSNNPYEDWSNYLKQAANRINNGDDVLLKIQNIRESISKNSSLDYSSTVALVRKTYDEISSTGKLANSTVFPQDTLNAMYTNPKYKDRKMWQDQLRFVATCAFSGSCDGNIVTGMDIDDELSQAVRFRPTQGYTSACTFTVLQGNYSSKNDYYAFLKWFYSTDLMYIPQALNSRLCTSTAAPYNGVEYGKVSRSQILNNDYIKAQMVDSMKGTSKRSAALAYCMAWANKTGDGERPSRMAAPALAPALAPAPIGGENIQDPINLGSIRSMQDLANDQAISNYAPGKTSDDFIYGDSQPGQQSEPGMYGDTYDFPKGRDIPYQNWGIGGSNARPSSHLNTPWNNVMPMGTFNNLTVSQ